MVWGDCGAGLCVLVGKKAAPLAALCCFLVSGLTVAEVTMEDR